MKKIVSISLYLSYLQSRTMLKIFQNEKGRMLRLAVIVMEELECPLFVIPKFPSRSGRNTFDLFIFSHRIVVEGRTAPRRRELVVG